MKRKVEYMLWQEGGGWACAHADFMGKSWVTGQTPQEALEKGVKAHENFLQFVAHIEGRCEPATCPFCTGHSAVQGIRGTMKAPAEEKT